MKSQGNRKNDNSILPNISFLNASRSHCIFTITVTLEGKNEKGEIAYYTSKLNLVDLAGSENSKISGSEHLRAKEAASINKSLLTLGRVINSLADKAPHIPYRESKLTRLLKDSLGGRTKTVIITTVDPFVQNMEDIKNTLEYGSHAKSISNLPQKNPLASQHMTMSLYKESLVKMQEQLRRCWEKNGRHVSNKEYEEMLLQIEVSRQKVVEKEEEMLMKIEISKQKMTEKDEEIKAIKAELEERRRKEKEREEEVVYWKKKLEDRDKEIEEIKKKEEEIDEEVARIEKEEEKAEGQRKKIDAECVELAQKRRTLESKRRQIKSMKRKRENEDEAAPMKKRK
jgi:kinesin family protein 11